MAEGFARHYGTEVVKVASAGIHPVGVHSYAVWAMNEVGINISAHKSKSLDAKSLSDFDYVVTLCASARDSCPVLPSSIVREHWPVPDPAASFGDPEQVIASFRVARYFIETKVRDLLDRLAQPVR